jgi:CO/xanthine dehydrogenase Mo-binding subunit
MNILPGNMRFGAGQPVKRLEDQRLLTGKGQFIDDRPEDGALWLHVLRSPHAHAKIVSIDIKAAKEMPGVEAVYTGADLLADDIGTLPTLSVFMRPDGSPMTVPPRRLLAHEIVRFAGEPIAAVVATSRVAAQTAAEAIAVEYEVLPSVVDPLEATKPGAPVVWANAPDNIVAAMSYGDAAAVEAVFATAAHVVSLDRQSAADSLRDGAAQRHRRDRQEIRAADPARTIADSGLDPRRSRRGRAETAEGKRARAGRRHRRRFWPEDQSLSGRRHGGLCGGEA